MCSRYLAGWKNLSSIMPNALANLISGRVLNFEILKANFGKVRNFTNLSPNQNMKYVFSCVDAHTCGNPVRLVKEGRPELRGQNMSEKRQHFLKEFDWIRTGLMFEPRGHDMMSGSILYPPHDPGNDIAVLFIETSGCLPMCGHGTI